MAFSFLSIVTLYTAFLRRCYASAGLSSRSVSLDSETTIQYWGPTKAIDQSTLPAKPALLLLHGFGPSAIWQWRQQVQFFSDRFQVYVPDLVFFGDSTTKSTSPGDRSEIFQATSVAKLMEKLGEDKFHVMGTSYGGFVAYQMARMWPERVEKVVIASSGVNMRKSDNSALLERAKCNNIENVMLPATAAELKKLTELAVFKQPRYIPAFFWKDFMDKLYSKNRMEKLELLKGLTLGRDENPNISPLPQDVLLVWGDQDQIFPLKMAHELKQIIGEKAKLEVVKNTSHCPQIENAPEFNNIVNKFLLGSS